MKFNHIIYILLFIGFTANAQSNKSKLKVQNNIGWLTQINRLFVKQKSLQAPFTPLNLNGNAIALYKVNLVVNADGFAKQIQTIISSNNKDSVINIIVEPIHFHFFSTPKKQEKFSAGELEFTNKEDNLISWNVVNTSENIKMSVSGFLTANGSLSYYVKITALNDVNFDNINFHIPMDKTVTKHLLGLGVTAPLRPDTVKYNWMDIKLAKGVWIGDKNAGLYYNLIDGNSNDKKNVARSWQNDGKGGIQINIKGSSMLADNFTGVKSFKKGDEIDYNFQLQILPMIKESQFNK